MSKILVALFVTIFVFSYVHASEIRYNLSTENSPFIGIEQAPVTIIEFIDYQ
ncbi:MAG: DsbA family protein [Thermodesulfovibrio sp.]|nr:DsbA family protein [Thermodesulfovibrio sp.]